MSMWRRLCVLAAVGSTSARAKVITGDMQLDSMVTEGYLTKFSFSPSQPGRMMANFTTWDLTYFDERKGHELNLVMFSDDDFVKYNKHIESGSLCAERIRRATWKRRIHPQLRNVKDNFRIFRLSAEVEAKDRAHYYYVLLTDCHLEDYDAHPPRIHYHVTLMNGDSHLPADEDGMTSVHLMLMLMGFAGLAVYAKLLFDQFSATGQVHLISLFLGTALAAELLSDFCELLHLWRYASDGKGLRWRHTVFALDFLSEALQGASELVISLTLLALAAGWTFVSPEEFLGAGGKGEAPEADDNDKKRRGMKGMLVVMRRPMDVLRGRSKRGLLFVGGLTLTQIFLELMGRRYEDDFNQFHDHEHWPGMALMAMRVLLSAYFFFGVHVALQKQPRPEIKAFLQKLRVAGMIWFLTFPVLVLLSPMLFYPYHRHCYITAGSIITQTAMLFAMMYMTLGNSSYVQISSVGRMKNSMLSALGGSKRRNVCID